MRWVGVSGRVGANPPRSLASRRWVAPPLRRSAGGPERRGRPLLGGLQLVLVAGGVGVFLADPVVALILQRLDQLGAAVLDDPAAVEDVDELGLDVGED